MNRNSIALLEVVATLLTCEVALAGSLDIQGDLNVSSNLTAQTVTLGGQTRSNWPSAGVGSAEDLGHAPILPSDKVGFYSIVLINHANWDFGPHANGWLFKLQIAQDASGGHTNVWPADIRWANNQAPAPTILPGRWDIFEIVDDGTRWNAAVSGLDYRDVCTSNCSSALQFNGDNYVITPSIGPRASTSPMTFEAWVKTSYAAAIHRYCIVEQNVCWVGGEGGVLVYLPDGDTAQGYLGNCTLNQYFFSTGAITNGVWHHVALCIGPSTSTLFVDGVAHSTHDTPSFTTAGDSLLIGMRFDEGGLGWVGEIDEVRISSVVRYTGNFTPATSWAVDGNTIACWRFNEGMGGNAYDEVGTPHGILLGSPKPVWVEGR